MGRFKPQIILRYLRRTACYGWHLFELGDLQYRFVAVSRECGVAVFNYITIGFVPSLNSYS